MRKEFALLIAACHLAACTTLVRAPYEASNPAGSIRSGETVSLKLQDGTFKRFEVATVTQARICGADECVPADQVTAVDRVEVDKWATAIAVLALVLVAVAAAASSSSFGLMPGFPAP